MKWITTLLTFFLFLLSAITYGEKLSPEPQSTRDQHSILIQKATTDQKTMLDQQKVNKVQRGPVNDSAIEVKWGYSGGIGPLNWGKLSEEFKLCSQGKSQSPIDIPRNTNLSNSNLIIHYQKAPLILVDDGVTNLMIGHTQTIINDGHGIQVNFPKTEETITYKGKDYKLVQFHMHTPSENVLLGKKFPAEIHFVHQALDGQLAVIAVFVNEGKTNPQLEAIIGNIPKEHGKEVKIKNTLVNPNELLPSSRNYFNFDGSLTTPPCSEGVHWIVMAQPIEAKAKQILQLKQAANGFNARPLQPLNHRQVTRNIVQS